MLSLLFWITADTLLDVVGICAMVYRIMCGVLYVSFVQSAIFYPAKTLLAFS
jgi:hypothetical protein